MNILTPTADGSNTLFNEHVGEYYHSTHGALQESKHVFIEAGLKKALHTGTKTIDILEVGFGTGLNFMLSFDYCEEIQVELNYTGIEAFPLSTAVITSTGFHNYVSPRVWQEFISGYENSLLSPEKLSPKCNLHIAHTTLANFSSTKKFDLLYYDAFSVRHQPDMWTNEMIAHACSFLKKEGIFVSYAITGNLKRALQSSGLEIEKLKGAPGKREMIRAVKL